jgi:hypothetical protein
MIEVTTTVQVDRSAAHAFDVVVRHQAENHPRWEDEVVEVRPLDEIVGVGHRSVMVRRELGGTRERVNECVEYVDGRRAAYSHSDRGMDFWIAFDFAEVAPERCEVTASVRFTLMGALRLMTPLFRLDAPRRGERITRSMGRVIEQTPAYVSRHVPEAERVNPSEGMMSG